MITDRINDINCIKKTHPMKKMLLFVMSLMSMTLFAQSPCVNGFADSFACNGYDLQSTFTLNELGGSSGNDSWGWTDPTTGNEYAITGIDNGTLFIDISDPVNPVILGKIQTHTNSSSWRDVKVYNNYAFMVSEASGHGMQIFDLTRLRNVANPPEIFTEDAHYNGFGHAHNLVINEDTGFAYAVGSDTFSGGPHFINIQDPLNPTAAGGYSGEGYSHDAQVVIYNGPDQDYTGHEIYVGSNTDEVVIVDVTNKNNPQTIATTGYSNIGYTHQGWFTEDHVYFIAGDEFDESNVGFNTRSIVLDFTDLDNPQPFFDYFGTEGSIDHNGYVYGDKFYLANYTAGLKVMDISDIANQNMVEIASFDTHPSDNDVYYGGAWNVYPYFASGNIIISNYDGGFFIVKPSQLSVNDETQSNFVMSPNPANNSINLNSANDMITNVSIVDVVGKTVYSEENINSNDKSIDVSSLAKGMYFVNINTNTTKKLIKN
jgi:choice-of-anchor B domain-containing protein